MLQKEYTCLVESIESLCSSLQGWFSLGQVLLAVSLPVAHYLSYLGHLTLFCVGNLLLLGDLLLLHGHFLDEGICIIVLLLQLYLLSSKLLLQVVHL